MGIAENPRNLGRALNTEWLETNGLGSTASGTVAGVNTRRYHGLFLCATKPPAGRRLLVGNLEEQLAVGPEEHALSGNIYDGVLHPLGYKHMAEFRLEPWPTWVYEAGGCRLTREVVMPYGQQAVILRYTLEEAPYPVWLVVRPLMAGRDSHSLQRARSDAPTRLTVGGERIEIALFDEDSRCVLSFPGGEPSRDGIWYYKLRYLVEEERGLDALEDLYSPGKIRWMLCPGESCALVASQDGAAIDVKAAIEDERERRDKVGASAKDPVERRLRRAADQFVCRRQVGERSFTTIVAGYPWFVDWGRDAMIALPGLLLSTCRLSEAREALELYIGAMRNGLTPNFFNDAGEAAAYNSADATLWTFAAAREYVQRSGDEEFAHWAYPRLADSMVRLRAGTDFSIYGDSDGLLCAGTPETQLTWMDAKADGRAVTPRWHKPVEVQALWHSAMITLALLGEMLGEPSAAEEMRAQAATAAAAFLAAFWDEGRGYLADCALPWGTDGVLRPNQVLALALPDGLVPDDIAKRCLAAVEAKLVTPYGLRTLAPGAPGYCAVYAGGPFARDRAYHQGTVWAWLMGPYVRAKMRLLGEGDEARLWARTLLAPLVAHLDAAGLGQISEIFDAQAPHMPRGCFAQAWSVAEVLRAWIDYGLGEME